MANFFQPGITPGEATRESTPSPAEQALAEYKAQLLQMLLNSAAGGAPSFADFTSGGPAQRPFPSNAGAGLGAVLAAMGQPGAFTSMVRETGSPAFQTPSMMNDLAQILGLAGMLSQSGVLDLGASALNKILAPLGGLLGIGGTNPAMGDATPSGGDYMTPYDMGAFDTSSVPGISLGDILNTANGGGSGFAFGESGIPYSQDYLNSGLIY